MRTHKFGPRVQHSADRAARDQNIVLQHHDIVIIIELALSFGKKVPNDVKTGDDAIRAVDVYRQNVFARHAAHGNLYA